MTKKDLLVYKMFLALTHPIGATLGAGKKGESQHTFNGIASEKGEPK